jgi:hypothetical protein
MQFGGTKPYNVMVNCIKEILKKHGISALRADDKQYMDDLFPNIKTYIRSGALLRSWRVGGSYDAKSIENILLCTCKCEFYNLQRIKRLELQG